MKLIQYKISKKIVVWACAIIVGAAGVITLLNARAASSSIVLEPENGTLANPASKVADSTASSAGAVKFSTGTTNPPLPPPPSGGAVTMVAASDTTGHCIADSIGDNCDGAKPASDLALQVKPDVVMLAGDYSPDGKAAQITTYFFPTWGRLKSVMKPAPGNHESKDPGMSGFFSYFGSTVSPPKGYYSYDVGAWHAVVLNSNGNVAEQAAWLQNDLASHKTQCTVAYWHEPLYSSAKRQGDIAFKPWWQVLYDNNADLVLNGHDHVYERFAPQTSNATADPTRGITQYLVGVGGDNLYPFGTTRPNSLVRRNDTRGFVQFSLQSGGWTSKLVSTSGTAFDPASGTCH